MIGFLELDQNKESEDRDSSMGELPEKFIVSKQPKKFLKQGLMHCGAHSVKAIVEAYGKGDKKNPEDYHWSWWGRVTSLATPLTWKKVLQKYGLKAEVGTAERLSSKERLNLLKELLSKDTPVMVRIGNGYLANGRYNSLRRQIIGHWVTLWGYDDQEQVFYVYDSAVPPALYERDIPRGNKRRSYQEMLRDWRGALFPWPWRYVYIKVLL